MNIRIRGLDPKPFQPLFSLSDSELAARGVQRQIVDSAVGFPDRVSLRDSEVGHSVLLLNYLHQPAATPYRASHAIYIAETASTAYDQLNQIPQALCIRTLSVRAFDRFHQMIDADLVEGERLLELAGHLLANPAASYLQAHYARRGCYAARIERA